MHACELGSLPKRGAIVSNGVLTCLIVSYNHFSVSIMVGLWDCGHHKTLFNLASNHTIADLAA